MTALSRSLTIAAGAGIAGLCLGLVIGDAPSIGQAETPDETDAYMVIIAEGQPQRFDALTALFEDHGAFEVAVTAPGPDTRIAEDQSVVVSRWPDLESAQAALSDPDFQALTQPGGEGPDLIDVLVAPVLSREPVR